MKVTMVGASLSVQGGITSVEKLILSHPQKTGSNKSFANFY